MNLRSFRSQVVIWYALWIAAVCLVAGALLYAGLSHYLESNLVALQRSRAHRIARILEQPGTIDPVALGARITADFAPEAIGRFVRVSDATGKVIYRSGAPVDGSFDPAAVGPAPDKVGVRHQVLAGNELLIATDEARPGADRLLVESGESLVPALAELRRVLFSLAAGVIVTAGVALAGGMVLVRKVLKPVADITDKAESITSHNLSERLPVVPTGDEFEQLSRSLNRMIHRLDEAFQHNRRFLADASHELRTPLTILRGELEQMMEHPPAPAKAASALASMLEEVERLGRIVETLFELSRLEAGDAHTKNTRFDLAKLSGDTAEQLVLLARDRGLSIACETSEPVYVQGDRARLKQVVVNLLDNAIKYTPEGGRVTLSVHARTGEAICEVADTGIGIPAEALPKIFDRFFRVDEARSRDAGGAGIGLAIVKIICAAHNGRVEVESEQGRGSRFRVHLPLASPV